ncbi:MAG: sialidase family protein [candidate division WOR-3 bacterium]
MILIFLLISQYQFLPAIKVNEDPAGQAFHTTISSGQHSIAARGDTIYLAYRGDQTGQANIYFTKSTDGGRTWSPSIRVNYPNQGIFQTLAVSKNGHIFIAYMDVGEEYTDISFTKSTDGGRNFSTPIRVNNIRGRHRYPVITCDTSGAKIFVGWRNSQGFDIYCSRSTNGGLSFEPEIMVNDTFPPAWQEALDITCSPSGETVYVVWEDNRNCDWDIYFDKSIDGGISFGLDILVNDTNGLTGIDQVHPSMAIDKKGWIYIVWRDYRDPGKGCYLAKSTDGGNSFCRPVKVSYLDASVDYPSIAVDDSNGVYVAWEDYGWGPTSKIIFGYSNNAGDTFIQNIRVDGSQTWVRCARPTLCINERKEVFVAWGDCRYDTTYENYDIFCAKGTKEMPKISEILFFKKKITPSFSNPIKNISQLFPKSSLFKIYDIKGNLVKKDKYKKLKKGIYFLIFDKRIIKIINVE